MFYKSVRILLNQFNKSSLNTRKNIFYPILCDPFSVQARSHVIFRRKHPVPAVKEYQSWRAKRLEDKYYIYELVSTEDSSIIPLKVILVKPVEDLGLPGDIVEVDPDLGRNELLLPGLAVYASPENLEKYKHLKDKQDYDIPSSQFVHKTIRFLESTVHTVYMSLENPWTIEPWHIKVGLRRDNISIPESSITLPATPISGPDLNLEGKEFLTKLKINDKEEARLRTRIRHVATLEANNLPLEENHLLKIAEPVFPGTEEAQILAELNEKDSKMILEEQF